MNDHQITDWIRIRHTDLIAEAAAERTARRAHANDKTAHHNTGTSLTTGLRRRAAVVLHDLANAIDHRPADGLS